MRRISDRVREYILVWPGDEREILQYDGENFRLPTRFEHARKDAPGGLWRLDSAKNVKGEWIPGTLVVRDIFGQDDNGNRIKKFDVFDLTVFLESEAGRRLTDRGLRVVEFAHEVPDAMAEGIPLWEASLDRGAIQTLQTEMARRKKWEDKGQDAPASSSEALVAKAHQHLLRRRISNAPALSSDAIRAVLSGRFDAVPAAAEAVPAPPRPPVKAPAFDPEAATASELYREATSLGLKLKAADKEGLLQEDEGARLRIAEMIQARREELLGLAPSPEGEGDAAAV